MPEELEEDTIREMGHDLGVGLFRIYSEAEAAKVLKISAGELEGLRRQSRIAYLRVNGQHVNYFGRQLLLYLLDCVVPVGEVAEPPVPAQSLPMPNRPAPELISVGDALALLGIGRTKLYELIGAKEIETVKIGKRTLIRRASLERFTGSRSS